MLLRGSAVVALVLLAGCFSESPPAPTEASLDSESLATSSAPDTGSPEVPAEPPALPPPPEPVQFAFGLPTLRGSWAWRIDLATEQPATCALNMFGSGHIYDPGVGNAGIYSANGTIGEMRLMLGERTVAAHALGQNTDEAMRPAFQVANEQVVRRIGRENGWTREIAPEDLVAFTGTRSYILYGSEFDVLDPNYFTTRPEMPLEVRVLCDGWVEVSLFAAPEVIILDQADLEEGVGVLGFWATAVIAQASANAQDGVMFEGHEVDTRLIVSASPNGQLRREVSITTPLGEGFVPADSGQTEYAHGSGRYVVYVDRAAVGDPGNGEIDLFCIGFFPWRPVDLARLVTEFGLIPESL